MGENDWLVAPYLWNFVILLHNFPTTSGNSDQKNILQTIYSSYYNSVIYCYGRKFWLAYSFSEQVAAKRNFVNVNLIFFFLAACANSLEDRFPYMFTIKSLIERRIRKLILNHLIKNCCPEFRNGLLYSYFSKLTLGNAFLELYFWTVTFKSVHSQ